MFGIDDAVSNVAALANTAIARIWPDATEIQKRKLDSLVQGLQNDFLLQFGQIDTNKLEAASANTFVSGWRPFVGWVCGAALAYAAILEPVARFIATVAFGYAGIFPVIDTEITLQILLGLLGLAGMRTFEKKNGVARP